MKIYTFKQGQVAFTITSEAVELALIKLNGSIELLKERLSCSVGYVCQMQIDIPRKFTLEDLVDTKET